MYDDTALYHLLIELAVSHPEYTAVIRALTPLALTRGKLLDAYTLSRKTRPLDGFPMFRFGELPVCSERSGVIASAVFGAVTEGFPGAWEQVEVVCDALKSEDIRHLCKASLTRDPEPPALFMERNSLPSNVPDVVIAQTVKILIARTANSLSEAPFDPTWRTRPYYEGKPEPSVIREKGGHRSLFCIDRGWHWCFQRVAYPSRRCDKPDNLHLRFVKNTPDERAVSCKNCRHHALEAGIRKWDLVLDGAITVHLGMGYLDALIQGQGFLPLGEPA